MGFLKCFVLLAWPLFALGYPICASIRAIETNSNYHMRKLITYWILFSLISLFELAFVNLLEWIPLWPYIKFGTICWLVLPQFKGSRYCYKSFVHPCFSVNLEEVLNRLYKRHEASLEKHKFLSVVDTYVSENGTEALEKLIAKKGSRTDFGMEGFKAIAEGEEKEIRSLIGLRTDFGVEEIEAVAEAEKKEMPPTVKSYCNELNVDQKDINRTELSYKNALVATNWVRPAETVLVQAEKKTFAAMEVKEVTVPPFPEKVQKEWTCALCKVTTTCQANLNSHLAGWKHIAKLKSKAIKQTAKNKASSSRSEHLRNWWCPYCAVICSSKIDFLSHLNGKKHLAKVQETAG